MADPFTILVGNLNALGFFGFLLPFVFVFVVVFGLLVKSDYFEDKRITGVLALVVAFFVIGFGGPGLANFFVNIFGMAALVLAGILILIFFVALTGANVSDVLGGRGVQAVLAGIAVIIFAVSVGSLGVVRVSDSVIGIIFVIIVLAIAIMFVTK